jgi:hypothetical protein
MSEKKFLDYNGLSYFWDKAKEYIEDNTIPKVNDASGKLPQFDANGNIVSSTKTINDFATAAQGTLANTALQPSDKGVANGVCPLNASVKIDSTYLPSYVDDVVEGYLNNNTFYSDSSYTDTIPSESGKIYVDLTTNKSYRWSGTQYTEITGGGLVIGTTSGTAFEGSRGLAIENNYLKAGESSGESSVTGFDPFEDTVHNIAQSLSSTQQIQARENINAQETLVSGTNIKTINMQNILGSGNIDTVNGYINANSVSDLNTNYPAGSIYSSKIALIPSQTTSGSLDYYTCVENGNTWEWQSAGTTAPIVSVQRVDVMQNLPTNEIYPSKCISGNGLADLSTSTVYEYDVEGLDIIYVTGRSWVSNSESSFRNFIVYLDDNGALISVDTSMNYRFNNTPTILTNEAIQLPEGTKLIRLNLSSGYLTNPVPSCGGKVSVPQSLVKSTVTPNTIIYGTVTIDVDSPSSVSSNTEITRTTRQSAFGIMFPLTYSNTVRPTPVIAMLHG